MTDVTEVPDPAAPEIATDRYHHGDLPNALRGAAADLIAERGLGAFSLREVARRAGVSHAAPAHHFGDTTGLLTSLAKEGFDYLADSIAEAADGIDDPAERLVAVGRAYVRVGGERPGHCQVMFRTDVVDVDDPELLAAGRRAYAVVEDTLRRVADAYNPELDVIDAANLCWTMSQGLLELYPKIALIGESQAHPAPSIEDLVERFTEIVLDGLRRA
jgi:AcrR family transcriptional regulator